MHPVALIALILILVQWLAKLGLEWLNRSHVTDRKEKLPDAFAGVMDESTYARTVEYTLARSRFAGLEDAVRVLTLIVVLFSGVLPLFWTWWTETLGSSTHASALGFIVLVLAISVPGLPLEWWSQFRLEERFGFNTTTQKTWWLDRIKGLILGLVVGLPLMSLLLRWVNWVGSGWWIWAAATVVVFQLVMMVVAPVLILPLFNKLQPLADGSLRDRLLALAERARFRARAIEVMDGSRRSRHSNAFFTGLGRFRKIVLFDTLLSQLSEEEIEAVLAHEIGHYRKGHIPKLLMLSILMTVGAFAVIGWAAGQPWLFHAFGFSEPSVPVALLLFVLLSDAVSFWFSPVTHALSRRFEYEADGFARGTLGAAAPLVSALRKLHSKNLSNLTPHPIYSRFHYSHPTLLERERALQA